VYLVIIAPRQGIWFCLRSATSAHVPAEVAQVSKHWAFFSNQMHRRWAGPEILAYQNFKDPRDHIGQFPLPSLLLENLRFSEPRFPHRLVLLLFESVFLKSWHSSPQSGHQVWGTVIAPDITGINGICGNYLGRQNSCVYPSFCVLSMPGLGCFLLWLSTICFHFPKSCLSH
jgi:hypothetical protein